MKPEKGQKFLCIKEVEMTDGDIDYIKGIIYTSDIDGCITDEEGCANHKWTTTEEHFVLLTDLKFQERYMAAPTKIDKADALISHLGDFKLTIYQSLELLSMVKNRIKELQD
ncbi:hypothetical protein CMU19_04400 [Elizabethkingia anophelis]|nr:hypothetical protein [Elizabethkingia anophelis]